MSRARRRSTPRRRARRSWRRIGLIALLAVAASAAILTVLVRFSQPPAHGPFHFPPPVAPTPPDVEIEPAERRQLDAILDGVRDDAAHGPGARR